MYAVIAGSQKDPRPPESITMWRTITMSKGWCKDYREARMSLYILVQDHSSEKSVRKLRLNYCNFLTISC